MQVAPAGDLPKYAAITGIFVEKKVDPDSLPPPPLRFCANSDQPALPLVIFKKDGLPLRVKALLDTGLVVTCISWSLADTLELTV